jgi:aspartate ammonia-lyase
MKVHPKLLESLVLVKKAAALVNAEQKRLEPGIAHAIVKSCDEILAGQWLDQFIADIWQAGDGTTINNNVNEVLANRAEELLGGAIGKYEIVDPHRHVNLSQSVNDVFPTAMRLALLAVLKDFEPALLDMERLLRRKAVEFSKIVKIGRTHLQDNVPITLGQEFNGFGSMIERSLKRLKEASNVLLELNIGGTHVGSGWDAHPSYQNRMVEQLSTMTKFRLRPGEDMFRLAQSMTDFVQISSAARELAIDLKKIAGDLCLLNSGPIGALGEITLPALVPQPSPLLPDILAVQIKPFLADSLKMLACQIIGIDAATVAAAQGGQLQSNGLSTLIIHNLLSTFDLAKICLYSFNQKCLSLISANSQRCQKHYAASGALFAALGEQIGLKEAQMLSAKYDGDGEKLCQAILQNNLLDATVLEKIFSSVYLTSPGMRPIVTDNNIRKPKID